MSTFLWAFMSLAQVHVTILSSRESVSESTATEQMDVFKSNKSQHFKDQWYCLGNQRFHSLSPIKFLMKSPNATASYPNSIQVSNKYWYKLLFLKISKQKMYPT